MDPQHGVQPTPEEDFAHLVDAVKRAPDRRDVLVKLLSERDPVYVGRSTNATTRMRGYALAMFEHVGLPDAALSYVLEELESGRDAYLVAAAAKAVRGLDNPSPQIVPFLFSAIENVKHADDAVTFESYRPRWPLPGHTTALGEIFRTFAWLGPIAWSALPRLEQMEQESETFSPVVREAIATAIEAIRPDSGKTAQTNDSCCSGPQRLAVDGQLARQGRHHMPVPTGVELEDQDGLRLTYGDFFAQQPSVLVFFYTRCMNPNKCSLTITKLARLQGSISRIGLQGQLRIAAITYDPGFDLPSRLRAYGENRGVVFHQNCRFLRALTEFEALDKYFELGVNFGPAVVNRHRIELFILDAIGSISATFARLQWDEQVVLQRAMTLLDG